MSKYSVHIICKNEEIYKEKLEMLKPFQSKICFTQWIPAEFIKVTACNRGVVKKLQTMYNTKQKAIVGKLGCIGAHRKALISIINSQSMNNIILEEDAVIEGSLPQPPKQTCYMGGWIVPPQVSKAGKVKVSIPKLKRNTINRIDYDKFKVITTHALFIKSVKDAEDILLDTIEKEKLKNYDIYLADNESIEYFYYPSVFAQGRHTSCIDKRVNKNDINTQNYGI
jgi:hypothetical protein